jgi:hypothetical protein
MTDEAATALITLTGLVLSQEDLSSTLDEVAPRRRARHRPAVGASVSSYVDGRPAAVAFSDDWVQAARRDAVRGARGPVPGLRPHRQRLPHPRPGRRAALAQLRAAGGRARGAQHDLDADGVRGQDHRALNTYAREPDAFTPRTPRSPSSIAAHAGLAVQVATAYFGHRDLARADAPGDAVARGIEQAKGILMAERRCTPRRGVRRSSWSCRSRPTASCATSPPPWSPRPCRVPDGAEDRQEETARMPHYRRAGDVPPKRHTQHRAPDGRLYAEELMGEEGFSSDSSLLYHRALPSALVDARRGSCPTRHDPQRPLLPRHLRLHDLFPG